MAARTGQYLAAAGEVGDAIRWGIGDAAATAEWRRGHQSQQASRFTVRACGLQTGPRPNSYAALLTHRRSGQQPNDAVVFEVFLYFLKKMLSQCLQRNIDLSIYDTHRLARRTKRRDLDQLVS